MRAMVALAWGASAGCESERPSPPEPEDSRTIGSFHIVGHGMYEGFKRWWDTVTPEDRAVIDEFVHRKDLLIHVFLAVGRLPPPGSRGGASGEASDPRAKAVCDFHPIVGRFSPERNWDVAYDPELTKKFEEDHGIPTPVEVVLQHEIFGHVIPVLRDPRLKKAFAKDSQLEAANECEALAIENRYRKLIGLREVPPELIGCHPS